MLDHTRSGHNSGEVKATLHSGPNEVAEVEPDVLLEDLLQSALDTTKQDPEAAAAGNFGRGSGKGVKDDEDGLDLPEVFQFPGEKARTLPERWRFPIRGQMRRRRGQQLFRQWRYSWRCRRTSGPSCRPSTQITRTR